MTTTGTKACNRYMDKHFPGSTRSDQVQWQFQSTNIGNTAARMTQN